ncbi:Alpha/Beta hydrolase protein, partial [Zopfochytrium polystomum]
MAWVPFFGRLGWNDYARLFFAVAFLVLEPVVRIVFSVFRPLATSLADVASAALAALFKLLGARRSSSSSSNADADADHSSSAPLDHSLHSRSRSRSSSTSSSSNSSTATSDSVEATAPPSRLPLLSETETPADKRAKRLHTAEDFVKSWGFRFEPHYNATQDGYILALHRIVPPKQQQQQASGLAGADDDGAPPPPRPVVLLWHGFMMSSEVWVCVPDKTQNLAYVLAAAGYDVWLGNTRGNKYSCKHKSLKSTQEAFWDFSLDHLALFDLKDSVEYILEVTGEKSLAYVGFSQGTMQGFSALSMSRSLNEKVHLFIALAPATKPQGIENKFIHALVNTSPEVIYLLFGRRTLLSSALFWQSILTPNTFATVIDLCTWGLFSWISDFIHHKSVVYRHLYSYTSVKMVVHWFQIIQTGRFQMYDENPTVLPGQAATAGHVVPKFPTEKIETPIALFWGGRDTLTDIHFILKNIPSPVFCLKLDEYEHLSFLWGRGIDKVVIPGVLGLLAQHSTPPALSRTSSASSLSTSAAAAASTLAPTSTSTPAAQARRTVPWISDAEVDSILALGR